MNNPAPSNEPTKPSPKDIPEGKGRGPYSSTASREDGYVAALAKTGSASMAADAVKPPGSKTNGSQSWRDRRRVNQSFDQRCQEAEESFAANIWQHVLHHSLVGEVRTTSKGIIVHKRSPDGLSAVPVYDINPRLLEVAARAVLPKLNVQKLSVEHSGKVTHEHTGIPGDQSISLSLSEIQRLPIEARTQLVSILRLVDQSRNADALMIESPPIVDAQYTDVTHEEDIKSQLREWCEGEGIEQ